MMPLLSLFINLSIAVLLVAVIIYCRTLNRNIRALQDSKSEMAKLFAEFDQSIAKAANSVTELREATDKADGILKDKLGTANMIADDLSFLIERGNRMADQLENGIKNRASATAPAAAAPTRPASPAPTENGIGKTTKNGSLESVLEQMANRNNPAGGPARPVEGKSNTRIRSKAEQELFDSLKSNR